MSSRFGQVFQIATFGESHGGAVGVVVDGCPPRLPIAVEEIQRDLDRRRPGQSRLTTPRQEADRVEILSGVFEGRTLGTPIALVVRNEDARPSAYEAMKDVFRPSHADYTTEAKYGIRNWQGGGRASARETVGRVAAGAIARKLLREAATLSDQAARKTKYEEANQLAHDGVLSVPLVHRTPPLLFRANVTGYTSSPIQTLLTTVTKQ